MGQILHGSATTTVGVRRSNPKQSSEHKNVAKQYSINPGAPSGAWPQAPPASFLEA